MVCAGERQSLIVGIHGAVGFFSSAAPPGLRRWLLWGADGVVARILPDPPSDHAWEKRAMRFLPLTISLLLALGCGSLRADDGSVLFSDDFAKLDQAWGLPGDNLHVENSKLIVQPLLNLGYTALYQGNLFGDADFRVKVVQAKGDADKSVGIVFWGEGYNSNYVAAIQTGGSFAIMRWVNHRWLFPFGWQKSDVIKQGTGQTNELRVVTQGDQATFFINGKQVAAIHGHPPEGSGLVGLRAESAAAPNQWHFSEFRVLKPTGDPGPAHARNSDPDLLFADNFTTLDPAWGAASEQVRTDGNKLIVQPKAPGKRIPYHGDLFGDVDVRVRTVDTTAGVDATAGILFWGSDDNDYYLALIRSNREFGIVRLVNHRWLFPVPWQASEAIKQDAGAINELHLVTVGNRLTFSVNGQELAAIRGYPASGGSQIGLYAEPGMPSTIWQFSEFKASKPTSGGPSSSGPSSSGAASSGAATSGTAADGTIFTDDFATLDPAWTFGLGSERIHVADQKLLLTPPAGVALNSLYQGSMFEDVDFRATVIESKGDGTMPAGLIFWSNGFADYYLAAIESSGMYSVLRYSNGKWLSPIPWQASDAVVKGTEKANNLRVVTKGNSATFYVNDKQVTDFKGFPPGGGSQIGLRALAGTSQASTWEFGSLSVRTPPK
jgi:hypothetical protein